MSMLIYEITVSNPEIGEYIYEFPLSCDNQALSKRFLACVDDIANHIDEVDAAVTVDIKEGKVFLRVKKGV